MKVFCASFLYLQFGFVIIWQNNNGVKGAGKMLVKLDFGPNNRKHMIRRNNFAN